MPEMTLNFVHPTDRRTISVVVDKTMTPNEALKYLIENAFIQSGGPGYDLAIKGGPQLQKDQPFADAGVKDGDTLRVLMASDAGAA